MQKKRDRNEWLFMNRFSLKGQPLWSIWVEGVIFIVGGAFLLYCFSEGIKENNIVYGSPLPFFERAGDIFMNRSGSKPLFFHRSETDAQNQ